MASSHQPSFLLDAPEKTTASDKKVGDKKVGATPLLAQYFEIKEKHQDCLLFFRLGDFYEMFFDDAVVASKALDIALTRRGQHQGQDVPMCGVPAHSYEGYVAKLIRKGFRVALCEQKETPEEAKKRGGKAIVTRDVIRVLTPGTLTEDSLLDARSVNHLVCLARVGGELAVAWGDVVGGHVWVQATTRVELAGVLARLDASEILVSEKLMEDASLREVLAFWREKIVAQPQGRFDSDNARRRILELYGVTDLGAFGDFSRTEVTALGALLDYIALTQKTDLKHFSAPRKAGAAHVIIDAATRRNLELTRTLQGERTGSLLDAIDRTETGAGARLLTARLMAPLAEVEAIEARLEAVAFFKDDASLRDKTRKALRGTPDLERALARLALGRGGPRDLAGVRDALRQAEILRGLFLAHEALPACVRQEAVDFGDHAVLIDTLSQALAADLPMLARDGNFIARGFSSALDEFVALRDDGRRLIAGLQQKYMAKTGVSGLKIKHNQIMGYHIEVTPTHADKLLGDKETFIHRQTLASCVRFTTVELSEMESKITDAAGRALSLELELFAELVRDVLAGLEAIRLVAQALASVDVAAALAALAVEQNYVRPVIDGSLAFDIKGGRHPVVEQALKKNGDVAFISNACDLAPEKSLWLLTGPNMAGKSTFLRQNALIALMAQMGSFVPATQVHMGVIDRLFSRVGAADDLAAGRSTFMVEMVETAAILNQATDRSLVILDEIGRGTATYDGLSIAWAVLEHLHEVNRCRALFATHYHELTVLDKTLPRLFCATMKIKEWDNAIVFLHEVIGGVADRSYGLHVAQMAGLPSSALVRAAEVLARLEQDKTGADKGPQAFVEALAPYNHCVASQETVRAVSAELEALLSDLDPDALSPKDALELVYRIKGLS